MSIPVARVLQPALQRLDPERAHGLALRALQLGMAGRGRADDPALAVSALGLSFPNPIGLAAGFDKNAVAVAALTRLGFGFIECGTVTPRPQAGNPRPRLFRLPDEQAVINRLGFNNGGLDAFVARLAAFRGGRVGQAGVPLGANIGINRDGADPERDYPALVAAVMPYADYVVVNVSSPNTPGLRDLQGEARLATILAAIDARRVPRPVLVKIAPDLSEAGLEAVVRVAIEWGVTGLIVANTTISRPAGLRSAGAVQAGGLSGPPLAPLALSMLRAARRLSGSRLVLIACGGITTGGDILTRVEAGAHLVQIYTAFAYQGPAVLARMKRQLLDAMHTRGFATLADAVGVEE